MSPAAPCSGLAEFSSTFKPRSDVTHIIFDFDGTLSWLRHGWPEIMCRLFREHIPMLPGETEEALHELLLSELLALNGKSSIHQVVRCVEIARARKAPTPDPEALLHEYQRRLDEAIATRIAAIIKKESTPEDFVVFNAGAVIRGLKERGLTLIILSGTVEHRVKEEAELLLLAPYFAHHIYGSTKDIVQSSKQKVVERLLSEEGIKGSNLLSFGDGPVEIQITKMLGGLAVGVASDEEVNGSGRLHPQKREQLQAAGADLIIPDYRDHATLLEALLGK